MTVSEESCKGENKRSRLPYVSTSRVFNSSNSDFTLIIIPLTSYI